MRIDNLSMQKSITFAIDNSPFNQQLTRWYSKTYQTLEAIKLDLKEASLVPKEEMDTFIEYLNLTGYYAPTTLATLIDVLTVYQLKIVELESRIQTLENP